MSYLRKDEIVKMKKRRGSILALLIMLSLFVALNLIQTDKSVAEAASEMNVTGVVITNMVYSSSPYITTVEVTMPDLTLDKNAFTITNTTTPTAPAMVTDAVYANGKYTLTISNMTLYDDYTLSIAKEDYETYQNSTFYGSLAVAEDLDLVNEPNIFTSFTRELTSNGIVTIGNDTFEAGAVLYDGNAYTAIDGNNGNPDNGTSVRLIGVFAKAPSGAKGVSTLRASGAMQQVTKDMLIDANMNYQETIQSGEDYYNAHKDDVGFVDNGLWKTLAFAPLYSQIASVRQSDGSRVLTDPSDRFRIIAWYDNYECTGTPIKVVRLMVKVDYTGSLKVGTDDNTAPGLTAGAVDRSSVTEATVKFTTSEAGTYYYSIVDNGAPVPDIDTSGAGTALSVGEITLNLNTLSDGAKDIYIKVKDKVGNVSTVLKLAIPEYQVIGKTLDLNGADSGNDRIVPLEAADSGLAASEAVVSTNETGSNLWDGEILTIVRIKEDGSADGSMNDVYGFLPSSIITVNGNAPAKGTDATGTLTSSGTQFAQWSYQSGIGTLTITFDSDATAALVQETVRSISYNNELPYGDARIRFTLSNGTDTVTADATVTSSVIYVDKTAYDAGKDAADGFNLAEALAVAKDGDKIYLQNGTYRGQFVAATAVTIDASLGENGDVTLEAPNTADLVKSEQDMLTNNGRWRVPILDLRTAVKGQGTVTVKNLKIDGRYQAIDDDYNANKDLIGIAVFDTNAVIDHVDVQHIAATVDEVTGDYSGMSENFGIVAEGSSSLSEKVTVTIKNSTIGTYQKTGIIAWGPKLHVVIQDNVITAVGIHGISNQNGMQIGSAGDRQNTTAVIHGNMISNLDTKDETYTATGILLRMCGNVEIYNNTVSVNDESRPASVNQCVGVDLMEVSTESNIHNNTFHNLQAGIQVESPYGTLYNSIHSIEDNDFTSCYYSVQDDTYGAENQLMITQSNTNEVTNGLGYEIYNLQGGNDSYHNTASVPARIYGGAGDDSIIAGSRDDILIGGSGNDTLTGGNGADQFFYDPTEDNGTDTIKDIGVGDYILVQGCSFTGTVSAGYGSAVAANSIQIYVNNGVTSLYIDTDGIENTPELHIDLEGEYNESNFMLSSDKIYYLAQFTAPTGLLWDTMIAGKAIWSSVEHASGYIVQLYKNGTAIGTAVNAGTATSYNFTAAIAISGAGSYTFKVTATGDGMVYTNSSISPASISYNYTAPQTNTTGNPTGGTSTTTVREVNVAVGNDNATTTATKVEIVRSTENSHKTDSVILNDSKVEEALLPSSDTTEKIVVYVNDIVQDPADEVEVNVTASSMQKLNNAEVALEIQTEEATIELPRESVQALSDKDLYFRVIPIRDNEQREETVQNAITANVVLNIAGNSKVTALGTPMTIETNYKNCATKVTFSLKNIAIPTDPAQREVFLSGLGVYIQHSDGEQVLEKGTIKYDTEGNPTGIEIEISKFSTFTIVSFTNHAPVIKNLKINGETKVGSTLTTVYTFTDAEQDSEGNTKIQWYRADSKKGKNQKLIAEGLSYQVTSEDEGKYLIVAVTPVAVTGESEGRQVTAFVKITMAKDTETVKNEAPKAISVKITGNLTVGNKLTVLYQYKDNENDQEGKSVYQWYRSDNKDGTNKTAISGAKKLSYTLTKADIGKYIFFSITPIAREGTKTGGIITATSKAPVGKEKITYKTHIKLGLIGSRSYAEKVAGLFEKEYHAGNVVVKKEGNYYRVYLDFTDKATADAACKDLKERAYIVNYYYYIK